jgi:hypothetical protein
MHTCFFGGTLKEGDNLEDVSIDRRIILKQILKIGWEYVG